MLLAVDIGNTNIHLGFCQNGKWIISWRARTVTDKMPDEYAVLLRNFLGSVNLTHEAINGVILGSVVPPLTLAFVELSKRYLDIDPLVVTNTTDRLSNAAEETAADGQPRRPRIVLQPKEAETEAAPSDGAQPASGTGSATE